MNTPNVNFIITDNSFSVGDITKGVRFIQGIFKRGKINKPDTLIGSWEQFVREFGGYVANNEDPIQVKRMLDGGAKLRVNRIAHYTNISDATTLTALKATICSGIIIDINNGPLVSGDVIGVDIDGNSFTSLFNTDNNTTINNLVTALNAADEVESAIAVPVTSGDIKQILVFPSTYAGVSSFTPTLVTGGSATVSSTPLNSVVNDQLETLFNITMKNEGEDYNNIQVYITDASNGDSSYFNMRVVHKLEPDLTENYPNLKIVGRPNLAQSTFLKDVQLRSQLLDFSYVDLSSSTGTMRPTNGLYQFDQGSNGGLVTNIDYIGDSSARTGFHAFNEYDEAFFLCCPSIADMTIHQAGAAYAANREDLIYWGHLNNALGTANDLANARDLSLIDTPFGVLSAGGLKITDPVTGAPIEISEVGDAMAISARSHENNGEWLSFFGLQNGLIRNALGVVNNFGTPALFNDRNMLANHQVALAVNAQGRLYLTNGYTLQKANSKMSFINIVCLVIYIKKALRPTLERYLEQPNYIPTWLQLYREVQPFFDDLRVKRGILDYRWEGDQFAKSMSESDLKINNPTDVDNGKYKVRLFLKTLSPIIEFTLDITLTTTGVDFATLN